MGSRRDDLFERLQREQAELLRRHLAELRDDPRGEIPPAPTAHDRAVAALASPAQRARVDALLVESGYTTGDLARTDGRRGPVREGLADDLTRARARALLAGGRRAPR